MRWASGSLCFGLIWVFLGGIMDGAGLKGPVVQSRFQSADAELNRTYQQLARALPARSRERLREAERAWLDFKARNDAAFRATATARGVSQAVVQQWDTIEIHARTEQLRQMLSQRQDASGSLATSEVKKAEAQLDSIYNQCLSGLSPDEGATLRQAQQAWVTFQVINSRFGPKISWLITSKRIAQLNGFYLQSSAPEANTVQVAPSSPSAPPPVAEKVDPTIPDPYETAR